MEIDCKMVVSNIQDGMTVIFEGKLGHKNPECEKCGNHTYALYQGGKKEKLNDAELKRIQDFIDAYINQGPEPNAP